MPFPIIKCVPDFLDSSFIPLKVTSPFEIIVNNVLTNASYLQLFRLDLKWMRFIQ
jgi:hypothetical protein